MSLAAEELRRLPRRVGLLLEETRERLRLRAQLSLEPRHR